jgi:hypothetical protein
VEAEIQEVFAENQSLNRQQGALNAEVKEHSLCVSSLLQIASIKFWKGMCAGILTSILRISLESQS